MTTKKTDKATSRVTEAAGAPTGNRRLRNEGRGDHAKNSGKNTLHKVAETLTGRKTNKP
jgi:uncharacterized protein YjbJ (UPF0337 family)